MRLKAESTERWGGDDQLRAVLPAAHPTVRQADIRNLAEVPAVGIHLIKQVTTPAGVPAGNEQLNEVLLGIAHLAGELLQRELPGVLQDLADGIFHKGVGLQSGSRHGQQMAFGGGHFGFRGFGFQQGLPQLENGLPKDQVSLDDLLRQFGKRHAHNRPGGALPEGDDKHLRILPGMDGNVFPAQARDPGPAEGLPHRQGLVVVYILGESVRSITNSTLPSGRNRSMLCPGWYPL